MTALRALVADDDPEMLELVTNIVAREFGATVERAATGHELLAVLAEHGPFDFIVTDVAMPWMTGLQVMHSARTAGLPIPVVVMTAMRDPEIALQVESLGEYARLLHKPFSFDELVAALHAVVRDVEPRSVLPLDGARRD